MNTDIVLRSSAKKKLPLDYYSYWFVFGILMVVGTSAYSQKTAVTTSITFRWVARVYIIGLAGNKQKRPIVCL